MDTITHYKEIVKEVVSEVMDSYETLPSKLKVQLITDEKNEQFLIYQNDWQQEKRRYGCFLHLEIANNAKIWIHHDGTDLVIVQTLLDKGIPEADIVLGFRSPAFRPYTGFAVA